MESPIEKLMTPFGEVSIVYKTDQHRASQDQHGGVRTGERTDDTTLITALTSSDLNERLSAQHSLITRGHEAVPALLAALVDDDAHRRSSAAQVLAVIADPSTAAALAEALNDDEAPVRWVAAEALIALGLVGAKAALRALVNAATISPQLKASVRHILIKLRDSAPVSKITQPVLDAMHKFEVDEMILVEAHRALSNLEDMMPDR